MDPNQLPPTSQDIRAGEPEERAVASSGESVEQSFVADGASRHRSEPYAPPPIPARTTEPAAAVSNTRRDRVRHAVASLMTVGAVVVTSGAFFLLTSVLVLVLAAVVVLGNFDLQTFQDASRMQEVVGSPVGFPMLVVVPQLALILPAIFAAILSRQSARRSLGLVRGHWPAWAWVASAFAAPLVGMVSGVICSLFMEESDQLKEMSAIFRKHGEAGFLIPLALLIGVTPALCEELLFRGFVQRRLTKAFAVLFGKPTAPVLGPLVGILVASGLFAVFHWDPVHVVAVFPIGLYLGWVSWRSGSLFPAMMGHLINNVISVVAVVMAPENQPDTLALPSVMFVLFILGTGGIGLIAMLIASIFYGRPERAELGAT